MTGEWTEDHLILIAVAMLTAVNDHSLAREPGPADPATVLERASGSSPVRRFQVVESAPGRVLGRRHALDKAVS